jgi:hypothetical protein
MNQDIVNDLVKSFKDARYRECNYYAADTLLATAALEWVTERLEGYLAKCLNVSDGYCDIWYSGSHTECEKLMSILYDLTANEKYLATFNKNIAN